MQLPVSLFDFLGQIQSGNALDSIAQWFFFQELFDFLDGEIDTFRHNVIGNILEVVSAVALTLLTIWILFKGWMIVSGRSRESMMGLVVDSLRATLIVFAASTMAFGASTVYEFISRDLPKGINEMVTGEFEHPARNIDNALTSMQVAMVAIDAIPTLDNSSNKTDKDRAVMLTGLGAAGPSVVGGALMLMYKMAIAMFVAFGPIFILCLLFDSTKSMFNKWLFYGIGTMFSMAVLNFMVTVAMKAVAAVTAAFAAQAVAAMAMGGSAQPISSLALQQGGLGMVLTVLLIVIPPMAANFFSGTLGQFSAYTQFGLGGGQQNPAVVGPAAAPPTPATTQTEQRGVADSRASGFQTTPTHAGRIVGDEQAPPRDEVRRST
jgi:type IV secretion system protein VirB6